MEYSLIEGKKIHSKNYECQSFRYVKSREFGDSIYLKCALFRTKSCTCIGKINKKTNLFELTGAHNHDLAAFNSGKIFISNTVKRRAENSTTNLRELFNETCRESDEASSVTFKRLESNMYKRKRILQPKLPSSALEFDSFLQESQYRTNHIQTIIYNDQVAVIWGSSQMVNFLRNAEEIQFDATFKVVPRLFYQLFTIFIHFRGHAFPVLHILMNRKTEKLYEAVLIIRRLIPEFNPVFAIGDFEEATRNALVSVIPSITIIGCWFHFTKAIFEKVRKLGLSKLYKQNQFFSFWIRKIMPLPLLPEEDIHPVYLFYGDTIN